jgi:hypothetical protein
MKESMVCKSRGNVSLIKVGNAKNLSELIYLRKKNFEFKFPFREFLSPESV